MSDRAPICVRISTRVRRLIDARRKQQSLSLSGWIRQTVEQRLQEDQGIGPDLAATLEEHNKQLRGIGINLNQLAHNANIGQPVTVPLLMLEAVDTHIRESRTLLNQIAQRLPS